MPGRRGPLSAEGPAATAGYEYSRVKRVAKQLDEGAKEVGIEKRPAEEVTPEKLHEEYMKRDYQDDYEMVRGPRPWEESKLGKDNKIVPRVEKSLKSYGV